MGAQPGLTKRADAPRPWIAFLRAINVPGHRRVTMTAVREAFLAAGCSHVRTVLQTGNVIFRPPRGTRSAVRVQQTLDRSLGGSTQIFLRSAVELERILAAAPRRGFPTSPAVKRYVAFLAQRPRLDSGAIWPLRQPRERLVAVALGAREAYIVSRCKPSGFYGFPNNFIEEALGIPATTRNWATLVTLARLTGGDA